MTAGLPAPGLRRIVCWVAAANLAYFAVESSVAVAVGSVSLLADSIDFLEDASISALVLLALGWSAAWRGHVGRVLAGVLLLPGIATAWTALGKLASPDAPEPVALALAGAGALVVNISCALALARHRGEGGSLAKAAFLSARNDAIANVAIIAAGGVTLLWASGWPDLAVGLGILAMNADAARQVWIAAGREEHGLEG